MPDELFLSPLPSDLPAEELGEISGAGENAEPSRQFCVFRAGRERYCLPVLEVEEVVDWPMVTRVPLGPPFLMGVFNLRGTIIAAVDIAVTEGRRPGLLPRSIIVAVLAGDDHNEDMHVGIAADEVIGTFPANSDSLLGHAPPDMPHCRAMLRHEERLALVLDLRQLIQAFSVHVI
jgi:purine-binding chemotaxis protein CheW